MSKNKLAKFADMETYPHVFQAADVAVNPTPFELKGKWHSDFFKNDNPIVLLGCGRGEYTVGPGTPVSRQKLYRCRHQGCPYVDGSNRLVERGIEKCGFPAHTHRIYRPFLCTGRSG